ncbi:MAG: DUF4065 domain-containing protein [Terracidiphilus sp.]|nr:DUF4065 domain-containing protein [Terracidiphilus sp.]
MPTSAHSVAQFIVQKAGTPISNLKLQKLLYYVQGWHLGIYEAPAFNEEIQAWVHGPVVPAIFHEYKNFKWNPIVVDSKPESLNPSLAKVTLAILASFGKLSAAQLETLSHQEAPWIEARKGTAADAPSQAVISHASMKRYFGKCANA